MYVSCAKLQFPIYAIKLDVPIFLHLAVSPLTCVALSWQLPFVNAIFGSGQQDILGQHIAIIGAGAGGLSVAYWISNAKERHGMNVQVDVYERNNYVGGSEHGFVFSSLFMHHATHYKFLDFFILFYSMSMTGDKIYHCPPL
jgi:hypothetical protein